MGIYTLVLMKLISEVVHSTSSLIRDSIMVSIRACHARDPGSIPGRGVFCELLQEKKKKKMIEPRYLPRVFGFMIRF